MSWDRPAMAAALAMLLEAATDETVMVFEEPPSSFNPPALVINYPATVTKHNPAFAVDLAELTVLAAAGVNDAGTLDGLLASATGAVEADPTLTGTVQVAKPTEWRSWRIITVSGVDMLAAEMALEVRM